MKIYLIRDTDRYKIGFSKEPSKRLKQLQTGSSEVMELVYEIECDTINIHDYAGPKATSLDIIVYTKNGGASKPFRMDIEDFKDLISNRDIILENKQIKMKYISEYNSTFKTFNEFLNEGKDASDILKESCDVWQKAQLDRELDFLKKGVDDTENIAADEIANIINAWIEDHTGIDMVVLKHYPETVDVKDFVTQWVMAKA